LIDRSLNYGPHLVRRFLESADGFTNALDLGAGHGRDLSAAREINPEAELLAVEVDPEYARELEQFGVQVVSLDLERDVLPFEDQSIHVVIANQILEHTKELFWILHEASRALRVGGSLILGVPNLASLHNRFLLVLGRQPTSLQPLSAHVRGFTRPGMLDFIDGCFPGGYSLVDFGGSNFYPFPPAIAKPLARFFPNLAWGIFFHLKKTRPYQSQFIDYPRQNPLETNYHLGER
jgi:SAM-dependent methyltransferase